MEAGEFDHRLQLQRAIWKNGQFYLGCSIDDLAAVLFGVPKRVMRALALPLRDQQLAMHSLFGLCLVVWEYLGQLCRHLRPLLLERWMATAQEELGRMGVHFPRWPQQAWRYRYIGLGNRIL